MTTRQEILDALKQADHRIDGIAASVTAHPETPLLEGEWTVRDCLSHVAARAPVTNIIARLEQRMAAAAAGDPPAVNITDVNDGQVQERTGSSVEELLTEIKAGHARAAQELPSIGDETLERRVPNFQGTGDSSMADVLLRNLHGHESGHLDQVEAALAASAGR